MLKLDTIKKNLIYSSPFLISVYTVLFLYANNQKEYRIETLLFPLIISIIYSVMIFSITKYIVKKTDIASITSTVLIFITLSYGRFLELGKDINIKLGSTKIDPELITGAIVLLVTLALFYFIYRLKSKLKPINKYLTILSLALVIFSLYNIISFELKTNRIAANSQTNNQTIKTNKEAINKNNPDIYYIILDRYAGPNSSKEQYNFDNKEFLNYLDEKGFYIAENSTTNYPKTFQSLGSSLNMEYINYLSDKTNGGKSGDESIVTPLIRNSKVLEFLKNNGYNYIHLGSWWEPTKINKNADYLYTYKYNEYLNVDEFTTGFLDTTIAAPILRTIFKDPIDVSKDRRNNLHRQTALYQFSELEKIPEIKGPKFVFAHILLPHDPFVFDENCSPISEEQVKQNNHQKNYINQLKCTNTKITKTIDTIISKSEKKPIIILQSDEGPFPMNSPLPPKQGWGLASTTSLREKFPILNAYYFPEKENTQLYDSITPVNSFRILFNSYFNQNLPLLEDKNYVFSDDDNYYKFIEVTEKVKPLTN